MLSAIQKQLIHKAARHPNVRLIDGTNKARYVTLLRNVAGVESSADPKFSQAAFEDAMAIMESMGFRNGGNPTYWQDRVTNRVGTGGSRMVFKIRKLHEQHDRYPLESLCLRFSNQRTDQVTKLYPREAWNLIEMLKDAIERECDCGKQVVTGEIGPCPGTPNQPAKSDFFNPTDFGADGAPW